MRTEAVRIARGLLGACIATGLAAALATAGERGASSKGCPFLVPGDQVQIEIAKVRFSDQIVSNEGQKVEVPKNRRHLFRYVIMTLKVTKKPGERLFLPLAGLTLHYYHGSEPDVAPCETASNFSTKLDDERGLNFPWDPSAGPWPRAETTPKTTEPAVAYLDVVYPMMEADTKECWITVPEPTAVEPFIVDGWKGGEAPEEPSPAPPPAPKPAKEQAPAPAPKAPAEAPKGPADAPKAPAGAPKVEGPPEAPKAPAEAPKAPKAPAEAPKAPKAPAEAPKGPAEAPKAQAAAKATEKAPPGPPPAAPAEKKPIPLLAMGNGVKVDIARVAFVKDVHGIDGNVRRLDERTRNVYRFAIVTLRIRKPAGVRYTLAAADLTIHYNRSERSEWAPCDGLSGFTRALDADRLMKVQDNQGPGWMKQVTGAAATDASEVYVDAMFPAVEKDVSQVWVCVSTPTAKEPFIATGWTPRPPGTE